MQTNVRATTRTFKLPNRIEQKMNEKLVLAGYGLRGKSKWIIDALTLFMSQPVEFCIDAIEIAEELGELNKSISFRPTEELESKLNDWVIKIRKEKPMIEGLKSKFIRAAICQGILRDSLK